MSVPESPDFNHSSIDLSNDSKNESKEKTKTVFSPFLDILCNKYVINIVIFVIITSHAIWATVYFIKNTDYLDWDAFNETTPKGYGLMVILYLIYVYSLIYYILIKPYILPKTRKLVWIPATEVLRKIRYGPIIFYVAILAITLAYLGYDTRDNQRRLIPLLGLAVFLATGFIFSANHRYVPWHTVAWGIILQFIFGFLTIRWEIGRNVLATFSDHVNTFLDYGMEAAAFTYGDFLVNDQQVFAFRALSVIFFIGFVVNLLYYYGLMQKFVNMLGEFLQYFMGTTICESVNSVAVAFVGMSEGPMMLRPYLKYLTDSELHSMMLAGFASVSGSTFAAYISYGARAQDLITASIMSAPSALCFSKLLYPETEEVKIKKKDVHMVSIEYSSAMDAASKGASDAFHLIAAIISGVTATLAFVYFINGVLTWFGILVGFTGEHAWTLELIAGKIFIPVAWIMGVEWDECEKVGQLIGIKTMVNEFVAFSRLKSLNLSARSRIIATYAICGFSNPGSIGILISTMAALVPEKQENVTRLVFRAFVGGALVCFMTACIAGLLMTDEAISDNSSSSNRTLNFLSNSTTLL
ncbi:sodium/nucleoside cotransporter 2-like isoform X2 [Anthonomus grandis grandis]|uniref:sodium/nucleoside cotransporter 2-like isoform X2 n=1 Tax=Anthonomus grandis grandis TaxID=2921223 RepID=UPI002165DB41|nr:sodium/nucleoside cotransporter 2-like isoform X2 [Anthonomus grandis grandis]